MGGQNYDETNHSYEFDNLIKVMWTGLPATDWVPPLLRYFDKFKYKRLLEFLKRLDNKFSADWICQYTPTDRIAAMNKVIQVIDDAQTTDEVFDSDSFAIDTAAFARVIDGPVYGRRFARYLLLMIPFFLAGSFTGLCIAAYSDRIGRIYLFDLMGAGMGSVADFSLCDNMAMNFYFLDEFTSFGILDNEKICRWTGQAIEEFNVKAPGVHALARQLSGGNLQKMILARVLTSNPRLLIVNSPTQGLDVGAAVFVQNRLLEMKNHGTGIILVSEDLDEVLALGDRIAPIYEGKLMGVFSRDNIDKAKVGLLMSGLEEEEE